MKKLILLTFLLGGCQPKTAAEADYLAEQLACVDKSASRADADQCRAAVKARWSVKDGGAE